MKLKVYNRPGYWRTLAWALVFFVAGMRGRISRTIERDSIRWEYAYIGRIWGRMQFHFFLVFAALMGANFRMDDTGVFIQFEMWESDNA